MEITVSLVVILCTAFFIAGLVDSIAGGGGLITLPSLLLCGVPPHIALGTGKFASTLGSLSALWSYIRSGLVVMKIAPAGFAAAALGSVIGSRIALLIDPALLGKILIFMLPVGMLASLLSRKSSDREEGLPRKGLWLRLIPLCVVIGMYDGFFGPGTGTFFIIAMHLLLKMGLVKASATSKVFNMASNLAAFLVFATGGVVLYSLGIPLAIANIAGNQVGVRLAVRVGPKLVRGFLYLVLTLLFATLIYRFVIA